MLRVCFFVFFFELLFSCVFRMKEFVYNNNLLHCRNFSSLNRRPVMREKESAKVEYASLQDMRGLSA